jgi:hypothetical protein
MFLQAGFISSLIRLAAPVDIGTACHASAKSGGGPPHSKTLRAGRARHSVRAVVVNQNVLVGRRRRAEDCPPYLREVSGSAPVLWRFAA